MYWYPMALNIWLTLSRCYSIFIYFPRKINTKKTERQNYHQVITSLLYCCPPPLYHTTSNSCCFTNYVFDYAISNVQCTICIYLCVLLLLFRFSCHNFFCICAKYHRYWALGCLTAYYYVHFHSECIDKNWWRIVFVIRNAILPP